MNEQTKDFVNRTIQFSADTIAFSESLPQGAAGWTIARQVIRSATSIGANFQEAQYSRSRAEFASKIQIALQEASESGYWFKVVEKSGLGDQTLLKGLMDESNQFVSILVSICNTTKQNSEDDDKPATSNPHSLRRQQDLVTLNS